MSIIGMLTIGPCRHTAAAHADKGDKVKTPLDTLNRCQEDNNKEKIILA